MPCDTCIKLYDDYRIQILTSINEIIKIRDVWIKMQQHQNVDIDFYIKVIQLRKNIICPYVQILYRNKTPVSMLIGRIEEGKFEAKFGYKTFHTLNVRSLIIPYGGILGTEFKSVTNFFLDFLFNDLKKRKVDLIKFNLLKINTELYNAVRKKPFFLFRDFLKKLNPHYRTVFQKSYDDFLNSLSKNTRENIRRYSNRLVRKYDDRISIKCYHDEHDIQRVINDVNNISRKTYQRAMGAANYTSKETRSLWEYAMKRQWIRVYILYIDDKPCAFWPGYLYNGTFYLGISGYDPNYSKDRIGNYLTIQAIEDLCKKEQTKIIDFGFGDAQYKRSLSNESWYESSVYIFSSTLKGFILNMIYTIICGTNNLSIKILKKVNLLNKIKYLWRNQLRRGKS